MLHLPGYAEPKPHCGVHVGNVACPKGHEKTYHVNYCGRPGCPRCWRRWLSEKMRAAASTFLGVWSALLAAGINLGLYRHGLVSPPRAVWEPRIKTQKGIDELYRMTVKVVQATGSSGGGIVFHHVRTSACGWGKYRRFDELRLAPHFHFVGFGPFAFPQRVWKATGWAVTYFPSARDTRTHLEDTFEYLLEHVALFRSGGRTCRTIRPFGVLAPNARRVRRQVQQATVPCKTCGTPQHLYRVKRVGDVVLRAIDRGVHFERKVTKVYRFVSWPKSLPPPPVKREPVISLRRWGRLKDAVARAMAARTKGGT